MTTQKQVVRKAAFWSLKNLTLRKKLSLFAALINNLKHKTMKKVFFAFAVVAALASVSSCKKGVCEGGTLDGKSKEDVYGAASGAVTQDAWQAACEAGGGKLK